MGKNQHFVPQFYLKRFSSTESERQINCALVDGRQILRNVSIRDQSSRKYFYGHGDFETLLGKIEGNVSRIFRKIIDTGFRDIDGDEISLLTLFIALQERCTLKPINDMLELHSQLKSALIESSTPENLVGFEDFLQEGSLSAQDHSKIAFEIFPHMLNLEFTIIRNRTKYEFLTCDHPVCLYNRAAIDNIVPDALGVTNSGLCIYLPLDPKHALLMFDPGIYWAPSLRGDFIDVKSAKIIDSLNGLIYCTSVKCVYFSRDEYYCSRIMEKFSSYRFRPQIEFSRFEKVSSNNHGITYRKIKPSEKLSQGSEFLFSHGRRTIKIRVPRNLIDYRKRMKFFDTGTGAGYIRNMAFSIAVDAFIEDVKQKKVGILSFQDWMNQRS